jgi:hypothetical protein
MFICRDGDGVQNDNIQAELEKGLKETFPSIRKSELFSRVFDGKDEDLLAAAENALIAMQAQQKFVLYAIFFAQTFILLIHRIFNVGDIIYNLARVGMEDIKNENPNFFSMPSPLLTPHGPPHGPPADKEEQEENAELLQLPPGWGVLPSVFPSTPPSSFHNIATHLPNIYGF